jgi:hypothetical protein
MFDAQITRWTQAVRDETLPVDDADRLGEIEALERLVCAVQARQARLAAAFDASQRRVSRRSWTPSFRALRPRSQPAASPSGARR